MGSLKKSCIHGRVHLKIAELCLWEYCPEVLHCKWPVHTEGECVSYKAVLQNSSAMQIFKLQDQVVIRRAEYKFARLW